METQRQIDSNYFTIGLFGPKRIGKSTLAIGAFYEMEGVVRVDVSGGVTVPSLCDTILGCFGFKLEPGEISSFKLDDVLRKSKMNRVNDGIKPSIPVIILDIDISCSEKEVKEILSIAKRFGESTRLATIIAVFSAGIMALPFNWANHRCTPMMIFEPSREDIKKYFLLLIDHLAFTKEEKADLANIACDAMGHSYTNYSMVLEQKEESLPPTLKACWGISGSLLRFCCGGIFTSTKVSKPKK